MMLMKYPQIVHDATQARLAKMTGEPAKWPRRFQAPIRWI